MHDVAGFVERPRVSNPTGWIGVMPCRILIVALTSTPESKMVRAQRITRANNQRSTRVTVLEDWYKGQQLRPKSSHAGPCYLWEPSVVGVGDNLEQLIDTTAPDRRDDPELRQMRANGVDDGGLLANEQMPRAIEVSNSFAARGSWSARTAYWVR